MSHLTDALTAWCQILGNEHVTTRREDMTAAEQATFRCERHISAILSPATTPQVRQCLAVASQYRVPVYPISRGRNWGLGSRLPASDGCVLRELSRMDRILTYEEQLSYLTVEPGVTFAQASAYLRERNSPH